MGFTEEECSDTLVLGNADIASGGANECSLDGSLVWLVFDCFDCLLILLI